MNWQAALILVCFLGLSVATISVIWRYKKDRRQFVKYKDLNRERVTPRFKVGGDAR
jgi:hypothetical protein